MCCAVLDWPLEKKSDTSGEVSETWLKSCASLTVI